MLNRHMLHFCQLFLDLVEFWGKVAHLVASRDFFHRSTSLPPTSGTVLVRIQSTNNLKSSISKPQRKQSIKICPRVETQTTGKDINLRRSNSNPRPIASHSNLSLNDVNKYQTEKAISVQNSYKSGSCSEV